PQVRQSLRCTHLECVCRHSSQPRALGVTSWIDSKWVHSAGMRPPQYFATAGARPAPARKACNVGTTCAPSPTAAATRFTEPDRTSPMANTPLRLVSSGWRSTPASEPVRTNPSSPGAQARSAHQEPALRDLAREVDDRLARRVAAAHEGYLLPGAEPRLDRRGPVVHARALERLQVPHVQAAVTRAAGDDDGACADPFPVREAEDEPPLDRPRVSPSKVPSLGRNRHLHAELLRLVVRAPHEGDAGDARR